MRRVAACVVVIGLVSTLALSASVAAPPRRHVTIAAGAVDGVYYPIAGAMSRITSDARGLSVRATVESSAGSVANAEDRKSTRLNSSHANISYAVFCLKKKKENKTKTYAAHQCETREHTQRTTKTNCKQ